VCRYSSDGKLRITTPCSLMLAACGLLVGMLSGFFGEGGEFLIVPALLLIIQMSMQRVVVTSVLVIALTGAPGLAARWWQRRNVTRGLMGLFALGGLGGMT